jgi:hypothetical protein
VRDRRERQSVDGRSHHQGHALAAPPPALALERLGLDGHRGAHRRIVQPFVGVCVCVFVCVCACV